MKKDAISNFKHLCDYQDALCDFILVNFTKNIKYDYPIPGISDIIDLTVKSLDQWKTKSVVKQDLFDIIRENKDENSILRIHMMFCDSKFCSEWFYGVGDIYKYRQNEKAKANSGIYACEKFCNIKTSQVSGKKMTHSSLKKDIVELAKILDRNIGDFYKKLEKEKQ